MDNHCMLDIETLGTDPDSTILSIAAVQFDPVTGWTGSTFKRNISLDSNLKAGRKISASTLEFWLNQRADIMKLMFLEPEEIGSVLADFYNWFNENDLQVIWGNSASFDCGLLSHAFKQVGITAPWNFRSEMCYRTITNLSAVPRDEWPVKDMARSHDPMYDCLYQIKVLTLILTKLNIHI